MSIPAFSRLSAALLVAMLVASAHAQSSAPSTERMESEVAGMKAENAALREQLRSIQEQQKAMLEQQNAMVSLITQLQRRLLHVLERQHHRALVSPPRGPARLRQDRAAGFEGPPVG